MVIVIVIVIFIIWCFMICWWYWVFWFRLDFKFYRFQDGSCCLLFFFRLLVIFLLESVTFYLLFHFLYPAGVSRILSSICFSWSHSHCSVHAMFPLSFHCWCILFGILYICLLLPCNNSTLLPYSGYVTIVFASSALAGHGICLPAHGALICSQNLAWSAHPVFQQP